VNPSSLDKCPHVYCWKCINRWAETSRTCPKCRVPIKKW
jgi:hypothetical protein